MNKYIKPSIKCASMDEALMFGSSVNQSVGNGSPLSKENEVVTNDPWGEIKSIWDEE